MKLLSIYTGRGVRLAVRYVLVFAHSEVSFKSSKWLFVEAGKRKQWNRSQCAEYDCVHVTLTGFSEYYMKR